MKSGTKTIIIVILALLLALAIGGCAFLFFGREEQKNPDITIDPSMSESEVVQYLKDQLSETQKQLTDSNVLLQQYLKQIEEANKNNTALTEQNQTLSSTIESLQETVKNLNAEIQRLTKLLEEYGKIADGTWEVHFYDGEEMIKLLLIRNNTKITETVTAEKEGFDFMGWATEQGGQVVNYQDIQITRATNFYAVFERTSGLFNGQGKRIKSWDELISQGDITTKENTITKANTGINGYLIVPDSITTIGQSAFKDCERLIKIDCYGVTQLDKGAFRNCKRLREINYGESIYIENFAFEGCDSLKSLVLPRDTQLSVYGNIFATSYLIEVVNNSTLSEDEIKEKLMIDSERDYDGIHSGESRIQTINGVKYYIYNDWNIAIGVADERENIELTAECNLVWRGAFRYQDQIKNIALNEGLCRLREETVQVSAFSNCTNLETIWIPFYLIDEGCLSDLGILVNSNPSTLTIYFDKESFEGYDQRDLDDFLKEQVTNTHPTKIQHYELGWSRKNYLEKFGF